MRKTTALIIGHTKFSKGACSPWGLPCEWDFNNLIADELAEELDIYHYDSYNFGYTNMVKRSANQTDPKDYKLILELHYNAATPAANGCEALHYFKNAKGKLLSEKFCQLYTSAMGGSNRGAKALYSPDQRGFGAVYYRKPTTLILEPFFGTSIEDVQRFQNGGTECYADVIRDLIKYSETL